MVSPPRPLNMGSTTAINPAIATAASKALPPSRSTDSPTWVTSGELEEATQSRVNTGERWSRNPIGF